MVHCPVLEFWYRGSKWSPPPPSDHPARGERGGVAPCMAEGGLHCLSLKQPTVVRLGARNVVRGVLSLWSLGIQGQVLSDTTIWVPNGLSQVGLARVHPDSEFYRNPVMTLGGILVCPTGSPTLLVLSALGLAQLPIGFFLKEGFF